MGRVGLLGGSFNPPHRGHLAMAETARVALGLDRVVLIPAARPPHKPGHPDMAAPDHRLAMTRLAAREHGFEVSDIELRRAGPSYTIDTVRALQAAHPEDAFFFVIGADTVGELPTWKEAGALLREVELVALNRPGHALDEGLAAVRAALGAEAAARIRVVPMPPQPVSSTEVREQLRRGTSPDALPRAVADYIRAARLYQPETMGSTER